MKNKNNSIRIWNCCHPECNEGSHFSFHPIQPVNKTQEYKCKYVINTQVIPTAMLLDTTFNQPTRPFLRQGDKVSLFGKMNSNEKVALDGLVTCKQIILLV